VQVHEQEEDKEEDEEEEFRLLPSRLRACYLAVIVSCLNCEILILLLFLILLMHLHQILFFILFLHKIAGGKGGEQINTRSLAAPTLVAYEKPSS